MPTNKAVSALPAQRIGGVACDADQQSCVGFTGTADNRRNDVNTLLAATSGDVTKAGKAIGLALGVGLGALGAGIGIGNIFSSMIQSVARQPELRGELTGIQWLGFALTEAVVFYGLLGSILAYVLV
jgi:F-type H+-transporting ATPase subunit c